MMETLALKFRWRIDGEMNDADRAVGFGTWSSIGFRCGIESIWDEIYAIRAEVGFLVGEMVCVPVAQQLEETFPK